MTNKIIGIEKTDNNVYILKVKDDKDQFSTFHAYQDIGDMLNSILNLFDEYNYSIVEHDKIGTLNDK